MKTVEEEREIYWLNKSGMWQVTDFTGSSATL